MFQLDLNNAFIGGDICEEVYMAVPEVLDVSELDLACKLNNSLYGLKQASKQWYAKITKILSVRGYIHSHHDYSLFYKKSDSLMVFVEVYVDDIVLKGTDTTKLNI